MRVKFLNNLVIAATTCLLTANLAHAGLTIGGGPIPGLPFGKSPTAAADKAYSRGFKAIEKAISLETKAAKASNAEKRDKLLTKAGAQYDKAIEKFREAISLKHDYHEAHGAMGNVFHRRGDYTAAFAAYNKALTIKPEYGPSLRDRGAAFLETYRINDAKSSYMALYKLDNRSYANEMMRYMNDWVDLRRQDPGKLQPDDVDAFASWLLTRSVIAQQAAAN